VGRLDYNSEGLIILTNDGELAERVLEGRIDKVYEVKVHLEPDGEQIRKLVRGITVDGISMRAEKIRHIEKARTSKDASNTWYEVVLLQGKNRQIRKMFERIGHTVMRLRRVSIGPVKLGKLRPGEYRPLSAGEIGALKGRKD
jgi:23S rRNA pseudouridine2605 synthase